MLRKLIFLLLLILAGYIGFMYFFGKGEDKTQAHVVVDETKEVVSAIGDFLKRQKEKYDEGEFDRLIEKVENTVHRMKTTKAEDKDAKKITLRELQMELRKIDTVKINEEDRQQLKKLMKDIEEKLGK